MWVNIQSSHGYYGFGHVFFKQKFFFSPVRPGQIWSNDSAEGIPPNGGLLRDFPPAQKKKSPEKNRLLGFYRNYIVILLRYMGLSGPFIYILLIHGPFPKK